MAQTKTLEETIQYLDDNGKNLKDPIIYNDLVGKTISSKDCLTAQLVIHY